LICLALPLFFVLSLVKQGVVGALLYGGLVVWLVYALSFLVRREGRSIPRAVVSLIAGISLLDAALLLLAQPGSAWVWAALGAFVLTLFGQRYIAGT
jgi:4-hydroxybenzoate polyprenyltransferase